MVLSLKLSLYFSCYPCQSLVWEALVEESHDVSLTTHNIFTVDKTHKILSVIQGYKKLKTELASTLCPYKKSYWVSYM